LHELHHVDIDKNPDLHDDTRCSFNPVDDQDHYFCSLYSAFDENLMKEGTFYYSLAQIRHEFPGTRNKNKGILLDITISATVEKSALDKFSETYMYKLFGK
jgi:hypothetical protein